MTVLFFLQFVTDGRTFLSETLFKTNNKNKKPFETVSVIDLIKTCIASFELFEILFSLIFY